MRELKGKQDEKSKGELEEVIKAIAEAAEIRYNKVVEELHKKETRRREDRCSKVLEN